MNVGFNKTADDKPAAEISFRPVAKDIGRDVDDTPSGNGDVGHLRLERTDAGAAQDQVESHMESTTVAEQITPTRAARRGLRRNDLAPGPKDILAVPPRHCQIAARRSSARTATPPDARRVRHEAAARASVAPRKRPVRTKKQKVMA
jgi:hypothetical protein